MNGYTIRIIEDSLVTVHGGHASRTPIIREFTSSNKYDLSVSMPESVLKTPLERAKMYIENMLPEKEENDIYDTETGSVFSEEKLSRMTMDESNRIRSQNIMIIEDFFDHSGRIQFGSKVGEKCVLRFSASWEYERVVHDQIVTISEIGDDYVRIEEDADFDFTIHGVRSDRAARLIPLELFHLSLWDTGLKCHVVTYTGGENDKLAWKLGMAYSREDADSIFRSSDPTYDPQNVIDSFSIPAPTISGSGSHFFGDGDEFGQTDDGFLVKTKYNLFMVTARATHPYYRDYRDKIHTFVGIVPAKRFDKSGQNTVEVLKLIKECLVKGLLEQVMFDDDSHFSDGYNYNFNVQLMPIVVHEREFASIKNQLGDRLLIVNERLY